MRIMNIGTDGASNPAMTGNLIIKAPPEHRGDGQFGLDAIRYPNTTNHRAMKALQDRDFECYLAEFPHAERPRQLQMIPDISDAEFCAVVRNLWISDPFQEVRDDLLALIQSRRPNRHFLMMDHERAIFDSLPDDFLIFSWVADEKTPLGWSWSLSEEVARRNAVLHGGYTGVVYQGHCIKSDVLAYFQVFGLQEQEIVINPQNVLILKFRIAFHHSVEAEEKPAWSPYQRPTSAPAKLE